MLCLGSHVQESQPRLTGGRTCKKVPHPNNFTTSKSHIVHTLHSLVVTKWENIFIFKKKQENVYFVCTRGERDENPKHVVRLKDLYPILTKGDEV